MCFQKDHTVRNVFLYTNGTDGFSAYKGKVPYGLSLGDTRRQVEARLGPPAKTGGAPIINFWVDYPSKFLGITYATKSNEDFEARIATLSLNIR